MDQIVQKFLNSQSVAVEYPGSILDSITNSAAPEHVANIIRMANGQFRLDPLQISHWHDTSVVRIGPPEHLNAGETWVGTIHSHPQLPSEVLAQSEGYDLRTARAFRGINRNFTASYVVGPSGVGPYVGVTDSL